MIRELRISQYSAITIVSPLFPGSRMETEMATN
jgi:hypothetical protein